MLVGVKRAKQNVSMPIKNKTPRGFASMKVK